MRCAGSKRRGAAIAVVLIAFVVTIGSTQLMAQSQGFPKPLTVSQIPREFLGTWKSINPRGESNCGSLRDHYGNPRELCEFPVDKLEKVLNGRARAWIEFFDEPLSPKWDCVAAGIQTVMQEGYLWRLSSRPDALIQEHEQSNWIREIWMDGRAHPPATDIFYHGHSIGRMEGDKGLVIETTNFTFDPDGWDDHSHIATSTRKKLTERYKLTGPDTMEIEFTVEDEIFLKEPFTWSHRYQKTNQAFISQWDCDNDAGYKELYGTIPQRYPDDTTPAKYVEP